MRLTLEYEQEQDGRWLAEVPELPDVIAYGRLAGTVGIESDLKPVWRRRLDHMIGVEIVERRHAIPSVAA